MASGYNPRAIRFGMGICIISMIGLGISYFTTPAFHEDKTKKNKQFRYDPNAPISRFKEDGTLKSKEELMLEVMKSASETDQPFWKKKK